MARTGRWLAFGVIAILAAIQTTTAGAAEVTVLSASAVHAVVTGLAETFRRETGHTVRPTFATAGQVQRRVTAGEATDIVIALDVAVEQMAGQGLVVQDTRTVIARVGAGVGVREGAGKPDISSTEAFKQSLLAAKSVARADPAGGGAVGIHFARVIERLGIAEAIKAKSVVTDDPVCGTVARGEAELCVTQISEILPVKGVMLVGPFPREVQNVTTFAAAVSTRSGAAEAARAFVKFLARPALRAKFDEAGLDYRQE
ncbi:molybdate ABC transporter substrate-binding protein [Bradyrhizobium erythrophlei]|uniref:molybdate ABC transporter substrate-binding protein n=1 Tax=Bradyrhizobium erythrophlei TaxID=1437360 RepID=UPI0035E4CD83